MKILNSNILKSLALIFMLLDHLWATIIPGNDWMNYLGRLAFPIFAFFIVEGFYKTKDIKKYLKRLFLFALISEIPFNLMYISSPFFIFHQNVFFTLFLGLFLIKVVDKLINDFSVKNLFKTLFVFILIIIVSIIGFVDYGLWGVLTILIFYLTRKIKMSWLFQLIYFILVFVVFFEGQIIEINFFDNVFNFPVQGFCIFSLPLIWMYNGKRIESNFFKYFNYWFYPIHMLIIYFIRYLL